MASQALEVNPTALAAQHLMALGGSSSAPALQNSPYAAVIGTQPPKKKSAKWTPPPGAFNNPDLPRFDAPGPGRYTPNTSLTKPRTTGTRFGSQDRFKYLSPLNPLEQTSTGMASLPQSALSAGSQASPGPGYMPKYGLVHSASRVSSFSVERRDTGGVSAAQRVNPGPGLYTPSDKVLSNKKNYTAGGAFLADDRHKYLGAVDPDSGQLRQSFGPGPSYNPSYAASEKRASTVAFGGNGPGTIREVPSLEMPTPGPGSYDHATTLAAGATLSTKPRASAPGFGSTQRGSKSFVRALGASKPHAAAAPPQCPTLPSSRAATRQLATASKHHIARSALSTIPPRYRCCDVTPLRAAAARAQADSSQCFHGKVPVDMTNATNTSISPGPAYVYDVTAVKPAPARPVFGTAKRVTPGQGIAGIDAAKPKRSSSQKSLP